MIGIYCIENTINNKKYIGQSSDITKRYINHKSRLKLNKHDNKYLQDSWNKYGKNNFNFYVLEECDENILGEKEIYWILKYNSFISQYGYNLTKGGENGLRGYSFSEESKRKKSEANKGESNYLFGKNLPDETKKKISLSMSGKNHPNYGKHLSYNTKNKISESQPYKRNRISSSSYIGVSFDKERKRWISYLRKDKKKITIGRYFSEKEAAKAYDKYVIDNNLDRKLNF